MVRLKKVLRISIAFLLLASTYSICTPLNFGYSEESYLLSQDQTLHFQTEEICFGDYGKAFLMDLTPVDGGVMEEDNKAGFVSLPLASYFTFSNVTITVHHTLIPKDGYQLLIRAGWLDTQNRSYVSHSDFENLEVGKQVTSHSFAVECCGVRVPEGQRFWL